MSSVPTLRLQPHARSDREAWRWARTQRLSLGCGLVVAAGALTVLAGWLFNIETVTSLVSGWPRMAPATALGFVCLGSALAAAAFRAGLGYLDRLRPVIIRTLASAGMLIGLGKLGDYWLGLDLNFDTLGFAGPATVAPATAVCFVLCSGGLWLAATKMFRIFQAISLSACLVAWLGFSGYFYGGEELPAFTQMALHTSLLFLLLSIGTLALRTDQGLMKLLASQTSGGRMALALLAFVPPLPIFLDGLRSLVSGSSWLAQANPMPLFASLYAVLLVGLVWLAGAKLARTEVARALAVAKGRTAALHLQCFVENAPAAVAMFDKDMRYMVYSRRWLRDFRLDGDNLCGRSHYDVFPDIPERWRAIHRQCLTGAVASAHEDEFERADGSTDWIHWDIKPWTDENGELGGIFMFSEVITERKHEQERIRRLNRVYSVLSEFNALPMRVRDPQTLYDEACRMAIELGGFQVAWVGMFNRAEGRIERKASAGLVGSDNLFEFLDVPENITEQTSLPARAILESEPVFINDLALEEGGRSAMYSEILRRGYRSVISLPLQMDNYVSGVISLWSNRPNQFDDDELKLLSELAKDISFALSYLTKQEELDYVSFYDVLTGLPNRTLFLDRLNQQLMRKAPNQRMAVLRFDLERFRMLNDTVGRHGGDEILRQVARRISMACEGADRVARVGADSFAVAVPDAGKAAAIAHEAENRILACFREPFDIGGSQLRISAKVGLAIYPADGGDADTLVRNAEAALKEAKQSGTGYVFYAAEMNAQTAEALALESRLREAVEAQEFRLHYQPKFRTDSGWICGMEALMRWYHPETGIVPPGKFIPVLEDTGLITEVGTWAIEQALRDYKTWMNRGVRVPRIAVNVSSKQLVQPNFLDQVIELVEDAGVGPDALELEITESLVMQDIESNIRKFSILRGMGIQVAMDDFGTGYSSLNYLARLPIDKLKIDRSFISGMTGNVQDRTIVSTVIALAHSFGLSVVAEGVETVDQSEALISLQCDELQGFLFSLPLAADEAFNLLSVSEVAA